MVKLKSRQLVSLLILSAMLTGTLAGCGGDSTPDVTSDANGETTQEVTGTEVDPRLTVSDDLPSVDYDGRTFTVITYEGVKEDIYIESMDGEVVNDAVFSARQTVSDRFNVNIDVMTESDYIAVEQTIQNSVLAGDESFQLAAQQVVSLGNLAVQNLFMNWYDVPHIDFTKPWWSRSMVEDLTYKNSSAYIAIGDYALSSLYNTYCFFYDKDDAEVYKLENLYDVVWDGRWTVDYLMDITKDMYSDLNGNAQRDGDDYYGYTQNLKTVMITWLWACGGKIMEMDSDGVPQLVYHSEHTNAIVEKIYKLLYESDGVTTDRDSKYPDSPWHFDVYAFTDGLSMFVNAPLNYAPSYFRDRDGDYGILPLPKFDEAQEEYYTVVDGAHTAMAVPKSASDVEFIGVITEALNAESYRKVFPAYYEIALKAKYTHDDESVRMLDLIVDSRIFDFGYVYDGWKGCSFYFQYLIGDAKSSDFESYYAKNGPASEQYYKSVCESLESIG